MPETYYIVPKEAHHALVVAAYEQRGYHHDEAEEGARFCDSASRHGIRTHNAIKALHLDHLFGSAVGGCQPGAHIEEKTSRYRASRIWNANRKLGQSVAYRAMKTCMRLADEYGVGMVSVDNAFHYLWGGGYVLEAAQQGYIAYTACTSALAEVVPFGGKFPTLGTNPHSWAFPTQEAIGYPVVIDWATSTIAMGRVQQFQREGKPLPLDSAVDAEGKPTQDPNKVAALLPFGQHKGYGLSLIDELLAAFIGGSLPTVRGRPQNTGDKHSTCFFFQVIHPDALSAGAFAKNRTQKENVKAVIEDILGHGNDSCMLPGQIEARAAAATDQHGGLLFTRAEIDAFIEIAKECETPVWKPEDFKTILC